MRWVGKVGVNYMVTNMNLNWLSGFFFFMGSKLYRTWVAGCRKPKSTSRTVFENPKRNLKFTLKRIFLLQKIIFYCVKKYPSQNTPLWGPK